MISGSCAFLFSSFFFILENITPVLRFIFRFRTETGPSRRTSALFF